MRSATTPRARRSKAHKRMDNGERGSSSPAGANLSPQFVSVSVTFETMNIGPYPETVRSLYGRGVWPHYNFIFPRSEVWTLLETKINEAYMTMDAYLAAEAYLYESKGI